MFADAASRWWWYLWYEGGNLGRLHYFRGNKAGPRWPIDRNCWLLISHSSSEKLMNKRVQSCCLFSMLLCHPTLNLAGRSPVLLFLLHSLQIRGSLTASKGSKPAGRSANCQQTTDTLLPQAKAWQTPHLCERRKCKYAYGYIKTYPIKTVHLVKSFSQGRVNYQLVTCQMLRHRLSLSSLFFTFHYIGQKSENKWI